MTNDDIIRESKSLSKNIQDVTNYRYLYNFGIISFDSPYIRIFEKYYDYLKANSQWILLDSKYHYKPEYLSYDVYQTRKFYELLMYVNNCYCIEDFTMTKVYIPSYDAIFDILKDYIKESDKKVILDSFEVGVKK